MLPPPLPLCSVKKYVPLFFFCLSLSLSLSLSLFYSLTFFCLSPFSLSMCVVHLDEKERQFPSTFFLCQFLLSSSHPRSLPTTRTPPTHTHTYTHTRTRIYRNDGVCCAGALQGRHAGHQRAQLPALRRGHHPQGPRGRRGRRRKGPARRTKHSGRHTHAHTCAHIHTRTHMTEETKTNNSHTRPPSASSPPPIAPTHFLPLGDSRSGGRHGAGAVQPGALSTRPLTLKCGYQDLRRHRRTLRAK